VRKGGTDRTSAWSAFVTGGARGDFFDLGTAWRTEVGARLDLAALSLELRSALAESSQQNPRHTIDSRELGLSVAAVRGFDVGPLTISAGLEVGGAWIGQDFIDPPNQPPGVFPMTPSRDSLGLYMGPLLELQLPVGRRLYARAEGAGLTYFLRAGDSSTSGGVSTTVTYRAGIGAGIYF
jgi:hypothetical protein